MSAFCGVVIAKCLREHHGINVNPITIPRDFTAIADEDMRANMANISLLNELPISLHLSNTNVCPDSGRPSDPRRRQGFTNASGIEKHDGSLDDSTVCGEHAYFCSEESQYWRSQVIRLCNLVTKLEPLT